MDQSDTGIPPWAQKRPPPSINGSVSKTMKIDGTKIVKTGEWLYDGTIPCQIVITRENLFPGSGDYEDPPEIANNKDIPCVQIRYENPSKRGDFNAGGGYAMTVDEAVRRVEDTIGSKVTWK